MNTKIGQCNLKPFVMLNCEDLEFSSEGVSVASCQIFMFRHETGSCYISGMLCPIYTKLHTFDKNPDLKRSNGAFPLHGTARYGTVRFTFGGFSTGYCTWYLILF